MRQKLIIIATLLLLTKFSYSQTVLIDKSGDTTVCISIPQMDKIYIELLQKDSLSEQAILSHSRELLLYEVIDSAKNDIKSLEQSLVYAIDSENMGLHLDNEKQKTQIRTNRSISFIAIVTLFLFIAFDN
jgi:hypothetical protein